MSNEQLITEIENLQQMANRLGHVYVQSRLPFTVDKFDKIMKPIILIEEACISAVKYVKAKKND